MISNASRQFGGLAWSPWGCVTAVVCLSMGTLGCQNLPRDDGQIWSCFGLVTEDVAGGSLTDTNLYFGGCSPADPGLQIVTYARATASEAEVIAACDTSCAAAFSRYWQGHTDVALPLHCNTLFVSACTDPVLGANTARLAGTGKNADFFSGGPADLRSALSGSISMSIDGSPGTVLASGVVDSTYGPCQGAGQSCTITLSRFDAVASQTFTLGGLSIEQAQVQMQGLGLGRQSASEFLIPTGAVNVEGNFTVAGQRSSVHASNDQMIKSLGQRRGDFNFDLNFGQSPRTMRVQMTGTLAGSPPVASFTPPGGSFECTCKNCTTVTLTSTTTDVDNDVQNLSWLVDNQVQSPFDQQLPLQLPVGAHSVKLVASDSRAAATSASAALNVVDTTPPALTVPPAVTVRSCDYPDIGRATAVDACSQAFVTNNDPGDFGSGITNVTWRAEDEAGNVSSAVQRVTVTQVPDVTCCPAGYNVIIGTNLADNLVGTPGNDCILGLDGNDTIDGLGGDDYIVGGNAQDRLTGGPGDDVLIGGEGDDIIDGGDGNDRISGGGGQDTITGGTGNDKIRGGRGDDTIHAGDGDDEVIGGDGQDLIYGEAGNDVLAGGPGDIRVLVGDGQHVLGGDGDDLLSGGITQDHLEGGPGNDILIGTDGDDLLEGGPGDDVFAAGKGHNQCVSGGGVDQFIMCEVTR